MHHAAPKELITKEWYDGSGALQNLAANTSVGKHTHKYEERREYPSLKTSSSSASTTMVYLKRTKAILQVVNSKITEEFFSI
jgi:hypothetical protein